MPQGPALPLLQQKSVSRRKCAACKIVVHTPCIAQLEKVSVVLSLSHPAPWAAEAPSALPHACTRTFMFHKNRLPGAPRCAWW